MLAKSNVYLSHAHSNILLEFIDQHLVLNMEAKTDAHLVQTVNQTSNSKGQ